MHCRECQKGKKSNKDWGRPRDLGAGGDHILKRDRATPAGATPRGVRRLAGRQGPDLTETLIAGLDGRDQGIGDLMEEETMETTRDENRVGVRDPPA